MMKSFPLIKLWIMWKTLFNFSRKNAVSSGNPQLPQSFNTTFHIFHNGTYFFFVKNFVFSSFRFLLQLHNHDEKAHGFL